MAYDEKLADRLRAAFKGRKGVEEKRMFGGIAFMLNGHMACGVTGKKLMVRTGADAWESALERPHVMQMDFTGRSIVGMVFVEPAGCATQAQVAAWTDLAAKVALAKPPKGNPERNK